ncbi:NACHT, LRR and PYD domains-containing protein 3-like [Gastrophryne carolinensis]
MGAKFAPSLANLFMGLWELIHIYEKGYTCLKVWKRYIDDCLIIWEGDEESFLDFFNSLNENNWGISFTFEKSMEKVHFLDLEISKRGGELVTKTFFKETDRNAYVPISSCHHPNWLKNIPKSQFIGVRRNCKEDEDYNKQAWIIGDRFINKGYDSLLIEREIKEYGKNHRILKRVLEKNWHILKNDDILGPTLPDKPKVIFRRPPTLATKLVRSYVRPRQEKMMGTINDMINSGHASRRGQRSAGDLLLYSLEDLTAQNFKRFKDKLSDLPFGDKALTPRGPLEGADHICTKNLLIQTYGEDAALDVTIEVFKLIHLMGPAEELEEQRARNGNRKFLFTGTLQKEEAAGKMEDWRDKYLDWVIGEYKCLEEGSRLGKVISLERRYTSLLMIKSHQNKQRRECEIRSFGGSQLQMMDNCSSTTLPSLFDPDRDGIVPKTVILQGPPGIGKTMTCQKIMLDWASGNLYRAKFDFVFHLSCRELNNLSEDLNISGLLSKSCRVPCPREVAEVILNDPGKVLLIVDGFDELRWSLEDDTRLCEDPFRETHKEVLLRSLLRKAVLQEASLIVTTRPFLLRKLKTFLMRPRSVAILGFTGQDREDYVYKFFRKKDQARRAFRIIQNNEVLFTICAVPILCWIMCTVLKTQIKKNPDQIQCKTATAIYLLYLKGLLKYHGRSRSAHTCLKKLCALANEGVLNQKILFEDADLVRHGITVSEVASMFLNENIFNVDLETCTCYSFIHLSIQEFLASLHYVLDYRSDKTMNKSLRPRYNNFLPDICKGNSFIEQCKRYPHLTLSVRFLFGLSSLQQKDVITKDIGVKMSHVVRAAMERWLIEDNPSRFCTEATYCLHETQDADLVRRVMSRTEELEFERSWYWNEDKMTTNVLSYCLKNCSNNGAIAILNYTMDPENQDMFPQLLSRFKTLRLTSCILTPPCCEDLRSVIATNHFLTKLVLSINELQDSGVKLLCEGLRHPDCMLQELK